MNILIPHSWLLEQLQTSAEPKKIQELVSLSGPSIERIYQKDGEPVYDIEVTTNRVDSMSVRGIAREAAVILSQAGIPSSLQTEPGAEINVHPTTPPLSLPKITNDPKLNKRTVCIVLDNITRNPTPSWMAKRLTEIEMNVHDAAIDITNYVTHELGHPCHAFDYDKLMNTGGEIIITEAQKGETFTTLDGETFTTVGGEVVFKNGEGTIIDLPSIKGTANTSVDDTTKRILLLLESIDAKKVRFASMTHAIRTTAAQLMEKNVDPNLAIPTLKRGVQLYCELCDATIGSELYDDFPGKQTPAPVSVPLSEFSRYLGIDIPTATIESILTNLGCAVTSDSNSLTVTPPTFRPDIAIKADVVEEVARMYGYHNLPSTLMDTAIPTVAPEHTNFRLEERIKHFLSTLGWQELYTYSMVSEAMAEASGLAVADHLPLANPLTEDKVYLRRSLIPSLQEVVQSQGAHSQAKTMSVFEIANVYHPHDGSLPEEMLLLGMLSTKPYREVRGDFEALCTKLHIPEVSFVVSQDNDQQASIQTQGETIGSIWIEDTGAIAVEVTMHGLITHAQTHPTYTPPSKTAHIFEDFTFTLPPKTPVGEVVSALSSCHKFVAEVSVKDIYNQNVTFSITFHRADKNIETKEIEPIRAKCKQVVQSKFGGKLVGAVT